MRQRVIDALIAIWFLFLAYNILNNRQIDNQLLLTALSFFYFTAAFAMLRELKWVRYLVYINFVGCILIILFVLYLAGMSTLPYLLIPLVLAAFSSIYCHRRFKNEDQIISVKREVSLFFIGLAVFISIVFSIGLFMDPSVTHLGGPVSIRD